MGLRGLLGLLRSPSFLLLKAGAAAAGPEPPPRLCSDSCWVSGEELCAGLGAGGGVAGSHKTVVVASTLKKKEVWRLKLKENPTERACWCLRA